MRRAPAMHAMQCVAHSSRWLGWLPISDCADTLDDAGAMRCDAMMAVRSCAAPSHSDRLCLSLHCTAMLCICFVCALRQDTTARHSAQRRVNPASHRIAAAMAANGSGSGSSGGSGAGSVVVGSVDDAHSECDCTCPLCACTYKDPLQLPCGHSLCLQCIRSWAVKSKEVRHARPGVGTRKWTMAARRARS